MHDRCGERLVAVVVLARPADVTEREQIIPPTPDQWLRGRTYVGARFSSNVSSVRALIFLTSEVARRCARSSHAEATAATCVCAFGVRVD